jgi:hypothetical protein
MDLKSGQKRLRSSWYRVAAEHAKAAPEAARGVGSLTQQRFRRF